MGSAAPIGVPSGRLRGLFVSGVSSRALTPAPLLLLPLAPVPLAQGLVPSVRRRALPLACFEGGGGEEQLLEADDDVVAVAGAEGAEAVVEAETEADEDAEEVEAAAAAASASGLRRLPGVTFFERLLTVALGLAGESVLPPSAPSSSAS